MTATNFNGVYIVGKRKPATGKTSDDRAKRMAEAIKRTAVYKKK